MSVLLLLAAAASAPRARSLNDFFDACNAIARNQREYDFCGEGFDAEERKNKNDRKVQKCFNDNLTQNGMNMCALMSFEIEDRMMKRQWIKTSIAMKRADKENDPPEQGRTSFADLLRGQRAWLIYRDATCSSISTLSGGSGAPMMYENCAADMTHLRTVELYDLSRSPMDPDEAL